MLRAPSRTGEWRDLLRAPRPRALTLLLPFVALVLACGTSARQASRTPAPERLTVYAAQSLAESFTAIARAFEAEHPGVRVELNLGGSSALATQIEEGAPADVFASADAPQMQRVVVRGLASEPRVFARNSLVVAVPADNPAGIEEVRDLAQAGVQLVLAADDVPIGRYARQVLAGVAQQAGDPEFERRVLANTISRESNVRAALAKVEIGEVDASIVYRTDVATTRAVRVVEIDPTVNVRAEYPIAALRDARNPERARDFVEYVVGPQGRRILHDAGFEPPS